MKIIRDSDKSIVAIRHWRAWYIDKELLAQMDRHYSPLHSFKLYFEKLETEPKIKRVINSNRRKLSETIRGNSYRRARQQIKQQATGKQGKENDGDKKPKGSLLRAISHPTIKKISRKK